MSGERVDWNERLAWIDECRPDWHRGHGCPFDPDVVIETAPLAIDPAAADQHVLQLSIAAVQILTHWNGPSFATSPEGQTTAALLLRRAAAALEDGR